MPRETARTAEVRRGMRHRPNAGNEARHEHENQETSELADRGRPERKDREGRPGGDHETNQIEQTQPCVRRGHRPQQPANEDQRHSPRKAAWRRYAAAKIRDLGHQHRPSEKKKQIAHCHPSGDPDTRECKGESARVQGHRRNRPMPNLTQRQTDRDDCDQPNCHERAWRCRRRRCTYGADRNGRADSRRKADQRHRWCQPPHGWGTTGCCDGGVRASDAPPTSCDERWPRLSW